MLGLPKSMEFNKRVPKQIDKEIPYHIIFLLEHDKKYQAWIGYKESVERETQRLNLQKQITILEAKIRKEKQLNIQMKLNGELKKLKKELETYVIMG